MVFTLQIVGFKKSGKTTVIHDFIAYCQQQQLPVFVIKHDAHDAQMDQPGTDTADFAKAGAAHVLLATQTGLFLHQTTPQPPTLPELLTFVPQSAQVVLIEGFKTADFPKIILLRSGDTCTDFSALTNLVATATLTNNPIADLDFSTTEKRVAWFAKYIKE